MAKAVTERTRLPGAPEPTREWSGGDGLTIRGDGWGPPDGPLVVLAHGGGQTRHAWRGAGETLGAAGYHAIAYDARGHSDSDWAVDGVYDSDANVRDLLGVVEAASAHQGERAKPILVGASMGGSTAMLAIGDGLLDAAALVLVDIAPETRPEGTAKIRAFMEQRPDGFDSLEQVADAIANYQPHRKRPRNLDGLAKNVRLGSDGRYYWHWDPARLTGFRNNDEYRRRVKAAADHLDLPVLLVRGALSDVVSEQGAQAFLEQCPHAEYVNVADAAHMVAGDRNDIFAGAVIEFLNRVVPVG